MTAAHPHLLYSKMAWPVVLLGSAGAAALVQTMPPPPPLKVGIMVWFLTICPGLAYLRLLDLDNVVAEAILAFALSLIIDTGVGAVLIYSGFGASLDLALDAIIGITVAGALLQVAGRPRKRAAG